MREGAVMLTLLTSWTTLGSHCRCW